MKMAVWFSRQKRLLLVMMSLTLLSACGSSEEGDVTAPALTLDALTSTTFERDRDLKGTVEPGSDVVVTVNTTATVGTVTNADDIWSCTISNLAVGSNIVTVRAADAEGNSNAIQFVLTYDLLPIDQIETVTAATDTTIYGRLIPDGIFNSVTLNGTDLVPPAVNADRTYSLDLPGLNVGSNTVTITAEDASAEPLTQTLSRTIVRDANAVSLTVDKPSPTDLHDLTLTGTVGAGGEVSVAVVPEATVGTVSYPTTTSWSVDISDLEEGESIITITAAQTGKISAATTTRVTVSSLPTVAPPTVPANNALDVSPDTLVIATFSEAVVGTTVNVDTFLLKAGGVTPVEGKVSYSAADKTAIFTPNELLPSGSYTATITGVKDPDGNIVFESWIFTVQ